MLTIDRGLPRALAAALAVGVLLAPVPAAAASTPSPVPRAVAEVLPPSHPPEGPVGGPQLGTRGEVLPLGAPPLPAEAVAHSWVVADLETGAVLGAKDPHGRYAPASTLKMLTAVALIPELDRDRKVAPVFEDVAVEGSKVGLVERVGYPVHELFSALLMVSGNDAANVLARAAGGTEQGMAVLNETARRLGARDTVAVNPHGLDAEGQTSSAYDLALIARAGMAMPEFRAYAGARSSSVSGPGGQRIAIANKNKLLAQYEGALGIKNGYTSAAKASFVGAAERDGRQLVVSMMRTQPKIHVEAAALLDWGFAVAAQGLPPVGQLVDPEPAPEEVSTTLALGPGAEAEPAALARDLPAQPAGVGASVPALSAAAVLVVTVVLRRRRVRLRY